MQIASLQVFRQRNRVVNVRYRVELSESERLELQGMLSGGEQAVRRLKRARILLAWTWAKARKGSPRPWAWGYRRCIGRGGVLWKVMSRVP